jgi:hypothetical protein
MVHWWVLVPCGPSERVPKKLIGHKEKNPVRKNPHSHYYYTNLIRKNPHSHYYYTNPTRKSPHSHYYYTF